MCCRCECFVRPVVGTWRWNRGSGWCLGQQVVGLVGLFRGMAEQRCCVAAAEWVLLVIGLLGIFGGYGLLRR